MFSTRKMRLKGRSLQTLPTRECKTSSVSRPEPRSVKSDQLSFTRPPQLCQYPLLFPVCPFTLTLAGLSAHYSHPCLTISHAPLHSQFCVPYACKQPAPLISTVA